MDVPCASLLGGRRLPSAAVGSGAGRVNGGGFRGGAAATVNGFGHLDESGRARMVDVSDKDVTRREATARAVVTMQPETARLIASGGVAKGTCWRWRRSRE